MKYNFKTFLIKNHHREKKRLTKFSAKTLLTKYLFTKKNKNQHYLLLIRVFCQFSDFVQQLRERRTTLRPLHHRGRGGGEEGGRGWEGEEEDDRRRKMWSTKGGIVLNKLYKIRLANLFLRQMNGWGDEGVSTSCQQRYMMAYSGWEARWGRYSRIPLVMSLTTSTLERFSNGVRPSA